MTNSVLHEPAEAVGQPLASLIGLSYILFLSKIKTKHHIMFLEKVFLMKYITEVPVWLIKKLAAMAAADVGKLASLHCFHMFPISEMHFHFLSVLL